MGIHPSDLGTPRGDLTTTRGNLGITVEDGWRAPPALTCTGGRLSTIHTPYCYSYLYYLEQLAPWGRPIPSAGGPTGEVPL